jgi:hypothetical protein
VTIADAVVEGAGPWLSLRDGGTSGETAAGVEVGGADGASAECDSDGAAGDVGGTVGAVHAATTTLTAVRLRAML